MTTLRLIADDLTGALDTAAQFTGRIGPLPVLLDRTTAAPEASYALNLSCRDGDEKTAVACTRDSLRCYSGADLAFKKIDSLLRGHWAAELAEIVKSGMFRRIVLAPAVPAQGRLTRGGLQMLAQSSGDSALIKDIPAELKRHGVSFRDAGCEIVVLDAESDIDLDAIAKRYANEQAVLWCGAAGLARALAQEPPRPARPLNQPHLMIVGSRHAGHPSSGRSLPRGEAGLLGAHDDRTQFCRPRPDNAPDVGMLRCPARSAIGSDRGGGGGAHCSGPRAAFRSPAAAWRTDGDRRGDIRCTLPRA